MAERNFLPVCCILTIKTVRSFDQEFLFQKDSRAEDLIFIKDIIKLNYQIN